MATPDDVTRLLRAWDAGDREAGERLLPLLQADLRKLARRRMRRERRGHTLQTDALVHEVYLRLAQGARIDWRDRRHLYALARRLMGRVLIDHARARRNGRRGGDIVKVPLGDLPLAAPTPSAAARAVADALDVLGSIAPRQRQVVECRFVAGLTVGETASALAVSPETVLRDCSRARQWLRAELTRTAATEVNQRSAVGHRPSVDQPSAVSRQ
jgi:RNA polymerase sigma factor (TIGR02999 family)